MNTITFEHLEKSFQSIAGLSSLDALDKFFMVNNMNRRLREAWNRAKWPELTEVASTTLFETNQGTKSTVPMTEDVLNVYDFHPWKEIQARVISYTLLDSRVVVGPTHPQDTIHILTRKGFTPYSEVSTDIPAFFENYLVAGILGDFFRGDNQMDKAQAQEGLAEEHLLREIDRVERLEQQNTPIVNQYNRQGVRQIFQST